MSIVFNEFFYFYTLCTRKGPLDFPDAMSYTRKGTKQKEDLTR